MLESFKNLSEAGSSQNWVAVPQADENTWSALSGLPSLNVPNSGTSNVTLNTAYMVARCTVTGFKTNCTDRRCIKGGARRYEPVDFSPNSEQLVRSKLQYYPQL